MNLTELVHLLDGTILTNHNDLSLEIKGCCAADLMSDVLASIRPEALLLTGLCNPQIVRTAQMADVTAIVLVRGKMPPKETIDLANEENIPLVSSPLGMYESCGRLHKAGVPSMENTVDNNDCSCESAPS
jgi:predicted transcriptional regulator